MNSSGKLALDDLGKDDLLKIMGKIAPDALLPKLQTDIQAACNELQSIETVVRSVS